MSVAKDPDRLKLLQTARNTEYEEPVILHLGRNGRLWLVPRGAFNALYRWHVDVYPTRLGASRREDMDRIAVWDAYDRKFVDGHERHISMDLTLREQMNALCALERKRIQQLRKKEPNEIRAIKRREKEFWQMSRGRGG